MDNIAQLSAALHQLLTLDANLLARQTNFIKRQVKFTGATFAQTTVLGWLKNPDASLEQLCDVADDLGCTISPQSLEQRFNQECADFMQQLLETALHILVNAPAVSVELFSHFNGVYLLDASIIKLPTALAQLWPGGANQYSDACAGLKLQLMLELSRGELQAQLGPAREHDRNTEFNTSALPPGSLRIADLGFYSASAFRQIEQNASYWLSRWKAGALLYKHKRKRLDLVALLSSCSDDEVEMSVLLGKQQVSARLLAVRVPRVVAAQRRAREREEAKRRGQRPSVQRLVLADWEISLTNVPATKLTLTQARVLYRMRWQIELLFKLWKGQGKVDESRSSKVWRVVSEVFAKLLAMVIEHWLLLETSWQEVQRSSWKMGQMLREQVGKLIAGWQRLEIVLAEIVTRLRHKVERYGKVNKRQQHPAAHQLLTGTASFVALA